MAYATQDDITDLYGPDALFAADRDGDGVADAVPVTRALDAASAEIDSYLASRYSLPFETTHPVLTQLCVDIALYRLASAADVATEELRRRYEDAVGALKRLAKGEQSLAIASSDLDEDGEADGPQPVVIDGPPRLFSRDKLRDF
ncbi:Mu-like prophage protein gp36 [Roseivivax halotolerans]|uniref:Mu-like prophage protein gp36 n=1 Tax=Roseivivax halotolerans TaxID=93684 RepID=A0A1I5W3L5_9RHOB|nr:DUF1320 domain-containing protein [Roseivivax halotolerans]SFQ14344.1 Mu-like prophage protein gp36 [Roseivivax halotolerans]